MFHSHEILNGGLGSVIGAIQTDAIQNDVNANGVILICEMEIGVILIDARASDARARGVTASLNCGNASYGTGSGSCLSSSVIWTCGRPNDERPCGVI